MLKAILKCSFGHNFITLQLGVDLALHNVYQKDRFVSLECFRTWLVRERIFCEGRPGKRLLIHCH